MAAENETAPEMIQRALDAGAYVTLAHPEWYSMTMSEADSVSHAHGVEIYNYSCVVGSNRGSGIAIADYLLQEGHRITFTATDDSHFEKPDWAGGWVMVSADLDEADIVDAKKVIIFILWRRYYRHRDRWRYPLFAVLQHHIYIWFQPWPFQTMDII